MVKAKPDLSVNRVSITPSERGVGILALSALEKATIGEGIQAARKLVNELKPVLDRLNVVYDSEGGVKSTVTQENLDLVADYSGITKAQVEDGMYAMTVTIRTAIANAYTQLVKLASRG